MNLLNLNSKGLDPVFGATPQIGYDYLDTAAPPQ